MTLYDAAAAGLTGSYVTCRPRASGCKQTVPACRRRCQAACVPYRLPPGAHTTDTSAHTQHPTRNAQAGSLAALMDHLVRLCTLAREARLEGSKRGENTAGVRAWDLEPRVLKGRAASPVRTVGCPPTWTGSGRVP